MRARCQIRGQRDVVIFNQLPQATNHLPVGLDFGIMCPLFCTQLCDFCLQTPDIRGFAIPMSPERLSVQLIWAGTMGSLYIRRLAA